jgi:TM2 domain-containing membrane protein YozV
METITKAADEKFCSECGAPIKVRAEICPKCGVRQLVATGRKSRSVAIVLTLFLGGIGAHRFYLNSPVVGVFYVLFCWTLIPGIIALFELIGLCCMGERDFNAKYNGADV